MLTFISEIMNKTKVETTDNNFNNLTGHPGKGQIKK